MTANLLRTERDRHRADRLVAAAGIDIDGATTFRWGHDLAVPRNAGIYVIADLRGPLYVGKSCNLRRRFTEHLEDSHNPLLRLAISAPAGTPTFAWTVVTTDDLNDTEGRYIRALRPLCNQTLIIHNTNN